MLRQMKALLLLLVTLPAIGQVSVSIQSADQAMLPSSLRTVYARVDGTDNLEVRWTATGGCTLGGTQTTAAPMRVTAPPRGASCSFTPHKASNEDPSFASAVSCRITATSAADRSKSASIVLPVCAPEVSLDVFPETTVLYRNQFAVIQSDLRGSVNTGVTWTITANPGGAGKLTGGVDNRHAVFSASRAGVYTLTATSKADPRRKAISTIYVTEHNLPAAAPDHTEPVDCTAVGDGKTYEVGPAEPIHDLISVPWNDLQPGDTVRIHNDDTTGKAPSTFHERFALAVSGGPGQPIRICGVPDGNGIKPVLDGEDSVSPKGADWAHGFLDGEAVIALYDRAHQFDPQPNQMRNILIEGLHIRNARPGFAYIRQKDGAATHFDKHAACIHIHSGREVMLRGNEIENCTQGVFINSQTPAGSVVRDVTVEGNSVHNWGEPHNYLVHGMYLQASGLQVQFNYIGASVAGAIGNVIKTRSVMNFLRWNYIAQPVTSTARAFDMVEPQSYVCHIIPYEFASYHHSGGKNDCNTPHGGAEKDPISPDQVAANFEAYHSDYVYGNVLDDSGSGAAFVHYGYDEQTTQGPGFDRRGGTLFYFSNTHLMRSSKGTKTIFDTAAPDGGHSYEFPVVESINNVFAAQGSTVYQWVRPFWSRVIVDSNWINPGSMLPNRDSKDSYQGGTSAADQTSCDHWGQCHPANGHMEWLRNGKRGSESATLYVGPTPFNLTTFVPSMKLRGLASALPEAIRDQPSNMQFFPATGRIAPRGGDNFLGALADN